MAQTDGMPAAALLCPPGVQLAGRLPARPNLLPVFDRNRPNHARFDRTWTVDNGSQPHQASFYLTKRSCGSQTQLHSAARIAAGHAFVQNPGRGHYELATDVPPPLRLARAFTELAQAI